VSRGSVFSVAAAATVLAGVLLALLPATPASAHGGATPAGTDYRSRLVAVKPEVSGLHLRVVQDGAHLELRNKTGREVMVLGYSGEPYLRITPEGVDVNTRSPAAYVNKTIDGRTAPPKDADADAEPSWRRQSSEPVARWHDHRAHWMEAGSPPAVQDDPHSAHRISTWTVDLVADGTTVKATGTLDYLPPPAAPVWWAGMLVAAGAVALLGRWRHGLPVLGAALAVAGAAELADGIGRTIEEGATGIGALGALLTSETYGTLTALTALAAAVLAVRRSPVAPFALALAAVCLAVLGGLTDVGVFSHALAPVPWAPELARLCTAAAIAVPAGVAVAGWLRVRADRPAPVAAPAAS